MDRRQVIVWGLGALALTMLGAGCRPRIRVKARPKLRVPTKPRPAPRLRPRRPGLGARITDAQGDALLDALIHEALGIDDLETRIKKLSETERLAALRQAKRRPRSARLDRVQRVLESSRGASRTRVRGR